MPTWALTNSIAMAHMTRPDKQFPGIRVMGTIGWVVVSAIGLLSALGKLEQFADVEFLNKLSGVNIETTTWPMLIGACIGVIAGIIAFFLPKTPPKSIGHKITAADILGLKALQLLKEPCFAIFVVCSFLIMFSGAFYWSFCNMFLNEIEWSYSQIKMSIGQMSEVVFMLVMPFFFRKLGVKKMLLVGMAAWVVRFLMFAFGNVESMVFMFYAGVALHGICYDFFFVTGQIYTDKKAPKEIQASAQGFISFITFGVGMLLGNTLAGFVVDNYVSDWEGAKAIAHNWQMIWIIPSCIAAVIFILFAVGFRDKQHDKFDSDSA
jgi:nucleoside transporter